MIEQFGPAVKMSSVDLRTLPDGAYFCWDGCMHIGIGTEGLTGDVLRSGRIGELERILLAHRLEFISLLVKHGKVLCQDSSNASSRPTYLL